MELCVEALGRASGALDWARLNEVLQKLTGPFLLRLNSLMDGVQTGGFVRGNVVRFLLRCIDIWRELTQPSMLRIDTCVCVALLRAILHASVMKFFCCSASAC